MTKRVIVVGGNSAYPPYEFINKNGEPDGFVVELTKAIAAEQGFEIIINLGDSWSDMRRALENGEVDILQGISYSQEREKILDFSPPHSFVSHSIFGHYNSPPVHSLEELKGKDVILLGRGIMHDYFIQANIGANIIPAKTLWDAVNLLSTGLHDYAVLATKPALYLISTHELNDIKIITKDIETKKYCYAVMKGNREILNLFNEGFAKLKASGKYKILHDKWLAKPELPLWLTRYATFTLIILASGLAFSLVWSHSLKRLVKIKTHALELEIERRRKAAEELKRQQQQLIQADKMAALGILVSGVAHEINNPIGLILLNLPTLSTVYSDLQPLLEEHYQRNGDFMIAGLPYSQMRTEMPLMLEEMQEAAKRIKRIVEDLKHFSRRGDVKHDDEVDINAVVQTSMRLVENAVKKATNHFKTYLCTNIPTIKGNAQRLEQVVVNLILNAAQALPDTERGIFVTTFFEASTKSVIIQVCDEGVGIPPEDMQHLTDPFFTTKRETGGTGLGLAISDGIVREHGGSIHFESVVGEGTTVIVRLPVLEDQK
ncbi:MAG: transporter substrate-binding domain-containing protein [Thermodesulfovibrionales bacterium]|nr:transporter substrate-binding domain-containing protein [Thermodesulfovibrionales bacterium]